MMPFHPIEPASPWSPSLSSQSTGSLPVTLLHVHPGIQACKSNNTLSTCPSTTLNHRHHCSPCFARCLQDDLPTIQPPDSSAPAPGLLGCAGENLTLTSTGTTTNLPARPSLLLSLFFLNPPPHSFLVSSLLYFLFFPTPLNLSQLSPSFSADDLPTNCLWDFCFRSFF